MHGNYFVAKIFLIIGVVLAMISCSNSNNTYLDAVEEMKLINETMDKVEDELTGINAEFAQLIRDGKYSEARAYNIKDARDENRLNDPERETLTLYLNALENQEKDRDRAIRWLSQISPYYNGILAEDIKTFKSEFLTREEIEYVENEYAKNHGVSIGMTKEQVLKSNWGKPDRINKTTSANGTREQWVYGSGNYLYFENGVLVTIQN